MGGKQPQASVSANTHHTIPVTSSFFAPALTTVVSLPLGFAFALGIQGTPLTYVISVVGFGLLTALDLKSGFMRSALGFVVTLLILSYFFQNSTLTPGISPSGEYTFVLVALPPAIGVFVSTVLFSRRERYRIPKQSILATLATGVGLVVGASRSSNSNLIGSNLVSSSLFIALGFGANCIQMVILFILDKFFQARKYSLAVLPTAFFSYNSIVGYDYFTSPTPTLGYVFFSSVAFLPILALTAIAASGIAVKMPKMPVKMITGHSKMPTVSIPPPRISIMGDHSIKQGRIETIKILTESEGRPRDMIGIKAEIQTPTGKHDTLRLAHVSTGKYSASYQASKPGNYNAHVIATDRAHHSSKQSFSFSVQPTVISHSPPISRPSPSISQPVPAPHQPPPVSHPPTPPPPVQRPPTPTPITTPSTPTGAIPRAGLPSLDRWDPKVWVNQEVHGYRIVEHIATGASGYVLRATFGQAGTEMALKIPILKSTIRPRAANEPTAGTITLNETMTEATRLLELSGQSKYVVQIRGILVDRLNIQEIMRGNTSLYYRSPPAIVMEYMRGGTAKRLIEDPEYEPLFYSEKWGGIVILLGYMIAQALDMIHRAGFVHLDVKPQNVLFNAKPPLTGQEMLDQMVAGTLVPKLADLGSAVRVEGKVVQFTSEYAPGEQVLGEDAQPAMDVYALGSSLYTMLTRTPVHSPRLIEAMNNMTTSTNVNKSAKELQSIWDSFSPDFSRIDPKFSPAIPVLKDMLARDPGRRPEAGSIANSLQKIVDKKGPLS